jgi:hypothetical protein
MGDVVALLETLEDVFDEHLPALGGDVMLGDFGTRDGFLVAGDLPLTIRLGGPNPLEGVATPIVVGILGGGEAF